MKLQDSSFKNSSEAGADNRLVSTEKIYVTALALNKTLEEAIVAMEIGGPSSSAIVANSALNSYDMTATVAGSIIRHQASGGVMYQLPTAVQGKKFFFVNEGVNPSGATVLTVDASNNKIDFTRGGTPFTATLANATYNHGSSGVSGTIGTQIKTAMEAADGATTFTVTFDLSEKSYKITGSATYFFRFSSGANVANTSRFLIGFLGLDGAEFVTNGTFAANVSGWTLIQDNAGTLVWSASNGGVGVLNEGNGNALTYRAVTGLTIGKAYSLSATFPALGDASINVWYNAPATPTTAGDVSLYTTPGGVTKILNFVARATTHYVGIAHGGGAAFRDVQFDNVSVSELSIGMSLHNEVRVQSNTGDQIAFRNSLSITPGYIALRKRGVMIAVTAIDATTWEVEQVTSITHIKNTTIGDNVRELSIVGKDAWVSKATGGTARFSLAGFSLNGYGYLANGDAGGYSNEVNQYNDTTNVWATKATGGTARAYLYGFSLNGFGYIGMGSTGVYLSEVNKYNDSANTWATVASGGTARNTLAEFSLNGYGYACGGDDGVFTALVEKYNDSANTWTTKATILAARSDLSGFSLNGYGYICGGGTTANNDLVDQYNDSANTWISRTVISGKRRGHGSFTLSGYGYVCCGSDSVSYVSLVERYNDSTNIWILKTNNTTARGGVNGFGLNGFGYVCNGTTGTNSNEVNQYN